jgi:hypothetical protein
VTPDPDPTEPAPPGRTPGWVVLVFLLAGMSAFLLFFTWLVRDSLTQLLHRVLRWLA